MLKGGKRPGCLEYPVSSSSSCLRIAVLCFGNHAFAFLKSKILLLNYFWKQDMTLFMSQFLPMSDLVKCQCFFFFVDQRLFCICSSTGVCCFQLNPTVYLERLLAVSSQKTADSLCKACVGVCFDAPHRCGYYCKACFRVYFGTQHRSGCVFFNACFEVCLGAPHHCGCFCNACFKVCFHAPHRYGCFSNAWIEVYFGAPHRCGCFNLLDPRYPNKCMSHLSWNASIFFCSDCQMVHDSLMDASTVMMHALKIPICKWMLVLYRRHKYSLLSSLH